MIEKLHPALPKSGAIYKDMVMELNAIQTEAKQRKLSKKQYLERIIALSQKIDERLVNEIAPLISGEALSPLTADDKFYELGFAAHEEAAKNPSDRSAANDAAVAALMEFDSAHRLHTPLKTVGDRHFAGDRQSTHDHMRLQIDRELVRYGDGLPPFKGNIDHRILMRRGLAYGLEKATAEELAEFFDLYCPCGKDGHDASDLGKLRKRLLIEAAQVREAVPPNYSRTNQQIATDEP
jgi:hypothetical protein